MATIQVRDIPQEVYDVIVRRAEANGQSIQRYMLQLVSEAASRPSKQELKLAIEANLRKHGSLATNEEILAAIDEGRR